MKRALSFEQRGKQCLLVCHDSTEFATGVAMVFILWLSLEPTKRHDKNLLATLSLPLSKTRQELTNSMIIVVYGMSLLTATCTKSGRVVLDNLSCLCYQISSPDLDLNTSYAQENYVFLLSLNK